MDANTDGKVNILLSVLYTEFLMRIKIDCTVTIWSSFGKVLAPKAIKGSFCCRVFQSYVSSVQTNATLYSNKWHVCLR
jgi:hypothetical protein